MLLKYLCKHGENVLVCRSFVDKAKLFLQIYTYRQCNRLNDGSDVKL